MRQIMGEDLRFLRQAGCSEWVMLHSLAVARKALELMDRIVISMDRYLVVEGAINHDIGRAETQGVDHAVRGAIIGRQFGMDERVILVIERHIGAGIPADEAEKLGLPRRDYVPQTAEEIIVAYADNLMYGDTERSFEDSLASFKRQLGENHPAIGRFITMHRTVQSWIG